MELKVWSFIGAFSMTSWWRNWRSAVGRLMLRKCVPFASHELVITILWSRVHEFNGMQHDLLTLRRSTNPPWGRSRLLTAYVYGIYLCRRKYTDYFSVNLLPVKQYINVREKRKIPWFRSAIGPAAILAWRTKWLNTKTDRSCVGQYHKYC